MVAMKEIKEEIERRRLADEEALKKMAEEIHDLEVARRLYAEHEIVMLDGTEMTDEDYDNMVKEIDTEIEAKEQEHDEFERELRRRSSGYYHRQIREEQREAKKAEREAAKEARLAMIEERKRRKREEEQK